MNNLTKGFFIELLKLMAAETVPVWRAQQEIQRLRPG
jgi:hypothetical protein